MTEHFFETISRCFSSVIYTRYGSVAVSMYSYSNKEGKQLSFRYVAYDTSTEALNQLSEEEQEKHIQVDKTFDISDVNFDEEFSVLKKINEVVKTFEIEIYSTW